MVNLKFFKKTKNNNQEIDEYEEISEKKTSRLGHVLLILLIIFLIIIGQKVFSDIQYIPERPIPPAYSIKTYSDIDYLRDLIYPPTRHFDEGYKIESHQPLIDAPKSTKGDLKFIRIPEFNEIDRKFEIDKKFKIIAPEIDSIISLNKDILDTKEEISSKNAQLDDLLMKYNVSLQEVIAREEALMDKPAIKESIISLDNEISLLDQELTQKTTERDQKLNAIEPNLIELETAYEAALEYYEGKQARYNFIVFLLKLLFVLPFFAVSLYFYFRLKRKNSPHTIIVAAVLTASSILFLQIVLIFLYQILPMEWLKRIFKILMEVAALKYVIYYGSVLLVIVIFGGIVYYIQKKVFDPRRIAIRRLKDNKCPNCSFTLDLSYDFCPKCGKQLKEKCPNCGKLKIKDLPHCPFCGEK